MAVNVDRTTISVATKILNAGIERAKRLGYKTFSAYISYLIQRDVTQRPQHVHIMDEPENALHPTPPAKYEPPLLVAEDKPEPPEDDGGGSGKKIGFSSKKKRGAGEVLFVPPNQWDGDHPRPMSTQG